MMTDRWEIMTKDICDYVRATCDKALNENKEIII